MKPSLCGLAALISSLVLASVAAAHEPLRAQIDAVTARIAMDSANARLYLERAELLSLNEQPQRAEADLRVAERLLPGSPEVDLLRASMLRDAGRLVSAERQLDAVIAARPELPRARVLRAEVRAALERPVDAIADLDVAIAHSRRQVPDVWLERARLLAGLGSTGVDRALASLDEGLRKLGASPALEELAVDLETRRGNFDSALARLDRMMAKLPRRESMLARRAEILAQAGRTLESWVSWSDALTAIESLPSHKRAAPALIALESRVREALLAQNSNASTTGTTP